MTDDERARTIMALVAMVRDGVHHASTLAARASESHAVEGTDIADAFRAVQTAISSVNDSPAMMTIRSAGIPPSIRSMGKKP